MSLRRPDLVEREVARVAADGVVEHVPDHIAVEEPLEIRVAGDPLAVTMRTPGEDRFLAAGFLFAEGVIGGVADLGSVAHCGRPGDDGFENVIEILPGPGVVLDPDRLEGSRRGTLITASCGVCGRRSIDDLLERIGEVEGVSVPREIVARAPEAFDEAQEAFRITGGLHAAIVHARDGAILAFAEDVGRHNAVDKVIGKLLYEGRLVEATILTVSGRVSFEIVQKAAAAGVPIIAAVSAPTSLAVDLAERAGITLAAFVRDGRMNVYAHAERIA